MQFASCGKAVYLATRLMFGRSLNSHLSFFWSKISTYNFLVNLLIFNVQIVFVLNLNCKFFLEENVVLVIIYDMFICLCKELLLHNLYIATPMKVNKVSL